MIDEFKSKISSLPSEHLCEIIISNRYLGIFIEESILSMEELALRRINGNSFDYENFIEEKIKELPKFNLTLQSFSILGNIFKGKL